MIQATSKMYRDNGDMFFAWYIEDENGLIGSIDDFNDMSSCQDSMMRHLAMWSNEQLCFVNGMPAIVKKAYA
jgi:hypothetical protein